MNRDFVDQDLGEIVRTVARWLAGLILAYGIYIVLYGHVTPGGGFAGGVIIACGLILQALAGGPKAGLSQFRLGAASVLDSAGVLLFLALACMGMWGFGSAFFQNFIATPEKSHFTLFSGGTMPIANIGLGVKVASSLFLVFAVLTAFRIVAARGKQTGEDQ